MIGAKKQLIGFAEKWRLIANTIDNAKKAEGMKLILVDLVKEFHLVTPTKPARSRRRSSK